MRSILAATTCATSIAFAATAGEGVEGIMGADRFIAGGTITRSQPVEGDLIGAGGTIDIASPVAGDAVLAGGNVRIGGSVGHNLYAAGGRLTLDGSIGRNARLAGGRVEIAEGGAIAGNLTAAGGEVSITGSVKGYVQANGGTVTIDGRVDGDVVANGGHIRLGPRARIGGNVTFRSGEDLARDPAAVVTGTIERLNAPVAARGEVSSAPRVGLHGGWIWSAGLILLAALFAAAIPPASMRVSDELRMHAALAMLVGFVALVCIPVAAIIVMLTVIGIPLAMLLLLAYVILLVLGYVAAAVGIGDAAVRQWRPAQAERSSWRVLAAVVAMLLLSLVSRIPYAGIVACFLAMLAGIGALLIAMRPRKQALPA